MKQALHIFRKDVRHLWPQVVVAMMLVTVHAVLDVLQEPTWTPQTQRINQLAGFSSLLLVLAWWNLIAAVIHGEVLPGDRQFWVTRPYYWKSLLGAKALFVLAFVNAPLLLSDCFVLGTQGFPVIRNLPDLFVRQFPVSGWLILPAVALATVTSGVGQFVLGLLLVLTGTIFEGMIAQALLAPTGTNVGLAVGFGGFWTEILLIAAFLGGTLWQFGKRRTGAVRAVMAVSIFVIAPGVAAIPWPGKDTLRGAKQQLNLSELRIGYDLRHPPPRDNRAGNLRSALPASLVLPLRITGLPAGTALVGGSQISIGGPNAGLAIPGSLQKDGDRYVQVMTVDPLTRERITSSAVSLRTSLRVTVVTDEVRTRVPAQQHTMAIPEVGFCEMYMQAPSEQQLLSCRSGVRAPRSTLVAVEWPGFHSERAQIGNLAVDRELPGGLSPVQKWITTLSGQAPVSSSSFFLNTQISDMLRHPEAELLFTPQWPLAETTREWTQANVDLSPYIWPQ